jgi:beta-lactamase superfamily II metal-dependent hydrolase
MTCLAQCHILDVGQGNCNIILLGDSRAIVIDCPKQGAMVALRLLERHSIAAIDVLAVTHNDSDHDRGASDILNEYAGRVGSVFYVQDRPAPDMAFARTAVYHLDKGYLRPSDFHRLEVNPRGRPQSLWRHAQKPIAVKVLYPNPAANLRAQYSANPNATSAVIVMESPRGRIIFPGDADIGAWQTIYSSRGCHRIKCSLIVVPHHGGQLGAVTVVNGKNAFRWLYDDVIEAGIGVVSVGTSNPHRHPLAVAIQALRLSGVQVMCTQITERCCTQVDTLRPGVSPPSQFSLSAMGKPRTTAGNPKNVACAGSIVADITEFGVTVPRLQEHRSNVAQNKLLAPLC